MESLLEAMDRITVAQNLVGTLRYFMLSKTKELAEKGFTPAEIAEELGIKVVSVPFEGLNGMVLSLDGDKYIAVNSSLTGIKRQFIIAHELGHFCLHSPTNAFVLQKTLPHIYDKHEYQADVFACELLLGEAAFKKHRNTLNLLCGRGKLDDTVAFLDAVNGELYTF